MGKTVLVTGGAGFIGKHTVSKLLDDNFDVVVADRKLQPKDMSCKYYQIDVASEDLKQVFEDNKIDYVIHLAALPSVIGSIKRPLEDCHDNYQATVNVCVFAKKYDVEKIVFSSTAAVYATPKYLPVDENHPTSCLSPYAITKNASENFIKYCGVDYIIFRYANVYGEGQDCFGEAGVVAKFFDLMSRNKEVNIHGTGEQTRDFICVEDVAAVNVLAIKSDVKNEIINVSTKISSSVNQLFDVLKEKLNYKKQPQYTARREGDIKDSILNNSKLIKLLNYKPSITLDEGIGILIKN